MKRSWYKNAVDNVWSNVAMLIWTAGWFAAGVYVGKYVLP